jgi:hypothetical protein
MMTGFSLSTTVTVKLQRFVLPLVSLAMHCTVVTPFGKLPPEGGTQTIVAPAQLSLTVGSNKTIASHRPGLVFARMLVGQAVTGGRLSFTVTVKAQAAAFWLVSVAVQATTVAPRGNWLPEGGMHCTVRPRQLSDAMIPKTTSAAQLPGSVDVAISCGQSISGRSRSCTTTRKLQEFVLRLASVATQLT